MIHRPLLLPPTSPALLCDEERPYFLWWLDATVADLKAALRDADPSRRAYWMGALLREANTRDVWIFVTPEEIRANWELVARHLGRARAMWAWLVGVEEPGAPPRGDRGA